MWGEEIKEKDGGGECNCDIVRTFVSVTMYPQYHNNMIIKKKHKKPHNVPSSLIS
jgi:hypothetical protein